MVISGNISATADLHIEGRVEGDIRCACLVQGADSVIVGRVEAQSVRLAGRVEGGIEAEELVIEASARLHGDISYASIAIAPGAHVDGRFNRKPTAGGTEEIKLLPNEAKEAAAAA